MPDDRPTDDFLEAYKAITFEVAQLGMILKANPSDQVARARLVELQKKLPGLRQGSLNRAAEGLQIVEKASMEVIARGLSRQEPEEQATLVVTLAESVTPAALAEILSAFETLHRELTGAPLRDLVAKIGLPDEIAVRSTFQQ
jgi:hypothetical protein